MIPPEPRLPDARPLIEQGRYFVVHAPRQTGKTTALMALAEELTERGRHIALLVSCERAEAAGNDYAAAELQLLDALRREAEVGRRMPTEWLPPNPWPDAEPGSRLFNALQDWALKCPLPLVLFFDEIDALRGQSLTSVLRQLRDGFRARSHAFPSSIVLCGLRDVRDYRAASGADPERIGTASPFNVKVASLRIANFTRDQVTELYLQHTAETGQEFTPEALDLGWEYSQGQPWLANALPYEIINRMCVQPPEPITAEHLQTARERLVLARETHLDSLVARLKEPRVRKFVEPLIAGDLVASDLTYDDDLSYVRDLGLIAQDPPLAIANPIYKEIIIRELGARARDSVLAEPRSFVLPDGRLDFRMVLEEFAGWWRQHGEFLVKGEVYHEVAPQLIIMAFLTRIVNGGGFVDCEYGVGRGRVDILVRKPYTDGNGKRAVQREAVEVKVRRAKSGDPLQEGLVQLDGYLDRLGLDTGTLVIFDRRPSAVKKHPDPKFSSERTPAGREVILLRA
jgi:AAA ATPase domain